MEREDENTAINPDENETTVSDEVYDFIDEQQGVDVASSRSDADTLEVTETDGSEYTESSEEDSDDDDLVLTENLIQCAQSGNYDEFVDLSVGAHDNVMLNWALATCTCPLITKFIVEEKQCSTCLGECYMVNCRDKNEPVIDYIESLDDSYFKEVTNDVIDEAMSLVTENEALFSSALKRIMNIKRSRNECTESDVLVMDQFIQSSKQAVRMIRSVFPEGVEKWEKENAAAASDHES